MIEINGKFEEWLKSHGHSVGKIQDVTHTYPIDSLADKTLGEVVKYMQMLIRVHGEDALYTEHWYYDQFEPELEVCKEETDKEYDNRITCLRKGYDRAVFTESEEYVKERKEIEAQIKALQEQLNNLKG